MRKPGAGSHPAFFRLLIYGFGMPREAGSTLAALILAVIKAPIPLDWFPLSILTISTLAMAIPVLANGSLTRNTLQTLSM